MFGFFYKIGTLIAVLDIVIVAVVLYWLMLMVKGTRAERMLWGLAVVVIAYFISQRAELVTLHWMLSNFLGSFIIFIIVVFQQDIRRALVQMGRPFSYRDTMRSREVLEEITSAVSAMSAARTGGLIVIERTVDLGGYLDTGVELDAKVSRELLLSIFNGKSPMHDGAVVVRGAKVFKAGCILPLTEKDVPDNLGTRHRAALGLAEETDAVITVVSEKTGEITLAVDDEFRPNIGADALFGELGKLFPADGSARKAFFSWKGNA